MECYHFDLGTRLLTWTTNNREWDGSNMEKDLQDSAWKRQGHMRRRCFQPAQHQLWATLEKIWPCAAAVRFRQLRRHIGPHCFLNCPHGLDRRKPQNLGALELLSLLAHITSKNHGGRCEQTHSKSFQETLRVTCVATCLVPRCCSLWRQLSHTPAV